MSSNNFDFEELARYYDESEKCRWCEQYHADCFHHAISRSRKYTGSLLNATPLNNQRCHLPMHGHLLKKDVAHMFIGQNIVHLVKQGYKFNDLDKQFIEEHDLMPLLTALAGNDEI